MKRHKTLLIFLIFVLLVLYILPQYGFLEINVTGLNPGSKFTYNLLDQKNQKSTEIKTTSTKIKKLVHKSSYELLVTQGEKNSFAVTKTGGFFTKKTANVKLIQENSRQFVGNNPDPCMNYLDKILISYVCGGSFSNIRLHVPATSNQPTYTINNPVGGYFGSVEGIVSTKEGNLMLFQPDAEQGVSHHYVFHIDDSLSPSNRTELAALSPDKTYSIKTYRDGFLVYDSAFEQILYYSSTGSQPTQIYIDKARDKKLEPYLLGTQGDKILVAYSNNGQGQLGGFEVSGDNIKNEIVVFGQGSSAHYIFDGLQYSDINLCGDNLCLVSEGQLSAYDIGNNNSRYLFSVNNVSSVANSTHGFLVVTARGVLNLNTDSRRGYIEYSLGDYKYCGMQVDNNGYLLCLINNKNKKVALRIDQVSKDQDNIDIKVEQLQKKVDVTDISIYGKYIYITPNLGSLTYNNAINGYAYNPQTQEKVKANIDKEIADLGINRAKYTINVLL